MNLRKLVVLSLSALAVLGSTLAEARDFHRRGHGHGGDRALLFAVPFIAAGAYLASRPYYRPYYAPRPYYYPAPVYYQPSPPEYIEQPAQYYAPQSQAQPQYQAQPQQQYRPQTQYQPQPQAESQPQPDTSWYYCADSQAHYPHVQSCPGGWQRQAQR